MKHNIVILYAEFMGYNYAAFKAFNALCPDVEMHLVSWDRQKLTPYEVPPIPNITYYNKSEFTVKTLKAFIENIKPIAIYIVGRTDKDYLKVVKDFKNKILIIGQSDEQYLGKWQQWVKILFSNFFYHQYFDYMWVSGTRQYEMAKRLGYKTEKILLNNYVYDTRFSKAGDILSSMQQRAKTVYYVGRFAPEKGIFLLVQAFLMVIDKFDEWNLVLVGNGPLKSAIPTHPKIIIKDFLQPDELLNQVSSIGIFCLPSIREPWGVVIQEFAAAGIPILCSNACGAGVDIVRNGYNGYVFKTSDINDLAEKLQTLFQLSDAKLKEMGENGRIMAQHIRPEIWAQTLKHIIYNQ